MLLESLRDKEQSLQCMLVFFDEVNVLKNAQGQAFIPWAFRVLSTSHTQHGNQFSSSSSSYSSSDDSPVKDATGEGSPLSGHGEHAKELKRTSILKKLRKITKVGTVGR